MSETEHYVDCERTCRDAATWSPDRRLTPAGGKGESHLSVRLNNSTRMLNTADALGTSAPMPRWVGLLMREVGPVGRRVAGMAGPRRDVATSAPVR